MSRKNTRREPRVSIFVRVDFKDKEDFIYYYSRNLSRGGIFIQTVDPLPPGTPIFLQLTLPGSTLPLEIESKVIWSRKEEEEGGTKVIPGMGIQFVRLDEQSKKLLDDFLKGKS
ncbi:MAG: TIGR02266 family protein [Deltaproteobacteria bacterium]|nr:MAG: TIGR02266 family protein [Deltaproteobacteria bacterium]